MGLASAPVPLAGLNHAHMVATTAVANSLLIAVLRIVLSLRDS